jgi:hypothetical protein
MTFKRLLLSSALVASLVLVPAAFGQDLGGGAVAPTTPAPAVPEVEAAQDEAPTAAQEDQPTTPEGEEQPPEEQPDGEQTPTEENGENGPVAELPEDGAGGEGGSLPETGLQLVALTSIGLGLLLAGAALWPTSSWPPPPDRRSRSTTRRSTAPRPRRPPVRPRTR